MHRYSESTLQAPAHYTTGTHTLQALTQLEDTIQVHTRTHTLQALLQLKGTL